MEFETFEQNLNVEKLIESLIVMLGRSNQRLDDLSKRVRQMEQYIIEAAPSTPPIHEVEESYSLIARVENPVSKTLEST